MRVQFVIEGAAAGKGRPRFNRATGRAFTPQKTVVAEARVVEAWRSAGSPWLGDGPLRATVFVIVQRPKSHFTTRGELSAAGRRAEWPTRKPDADNQLKLIFDSLNRLAYSDDSQIVDIMYVKRWARDPRERERVLLTLEQIPTAQLLEDTARMAA